MPARPTPESPLVLGSASPRRREILSTLKVPFVVVTGDADETVRPGERPAAYVERIALAKLEAVRGRAPANAPAILVADTTVVLGPDVLGKPADQAETLAMIRRLSGRTHEVLTRFLVALPEAGPPLHGETVRTEVTFRDVEDEEAEAYAASGEGLDKAGGYGVQGYAGAFVARIVGSYSNIVGLPSCEVAVALRRLGLR